MDLTDLALLRPDFVKFFMTMLRALGQSVTSNCGFLFLGRFSLSG